LARGAKGGRQSNLQRLMIRFSRGGEGAGCARASAAAAASHGAKGDRVAKGRQMENNQRIVRQACIRGRRETAAAGNESNMAGAKGIRVAVRGH